MPENDYSYTRFRVLMLILALGATLAGLGLLVVYVIL